MGEKRRPTSFFGESPAYRFSWPRHFVISVVITVLRPAGIKCAKNTAW